MKSIEKTMAAMLVLASVLLFIAGEGYAASADGSDAVLATIGSHKITEREVDRKLRVPLDGVEAEIYQVKEHGIDGMVADYLIQQAAQKAHLSVDAYLKREVDDKVPPPPEAQIKAEYELFKAQLRRSYEEEKPGLIDYLKDQEKQQARNDLVGRLRTETTVQILLEAPRFFVPTNDDPSLGPKNAPVTIVEFGDFECPFTKKAERPLKQVLAKYGKKVRLVYIDHPLWLHLHAGLADRAARCADEQGKFWPYHDALFADQSKLETKDLKATAARLKLDTQKFNQCLDQGATDAKLGKDQLEAGMLRVEGTPTFYVNGRLLFGVESTQDLEKVIDQELGSAAGRRVARSHD